MTARGRPMRGAAVLVALALVACNQPSGPPPVVSLDGHACSDTPELAGARPVLLGADKAVTVDLAGNAACLQAADGVRSVYAVFLLPEAPEPYLVTVASLPQGQTLFSPRLLVLDANGAVMQTVPRETFLFHGAILSAALRTHGQERYVVVASDLASVGQNVSQLTAATQTTTAPVGVGFVMIRTGSESNQTYTYAHNGRITVSAQPIPKVN